MPPVDTHDLEVRIVRLETTIGDKDSGLVSDIHGIKACVEGLKQFQWKLFGDHGRVDLVLDRAASPRRA